jgi:hypothetical protein
MPIQGLTNRHLSIHIAWDKNAISLKSKLNQGHDSQNTVSIELMSLLFNAFLRY